MRIAIIIIFALNISKVVSLPPLQMVYTGDVLYERYLQEKVCPNSKHKNSKYIPILLTNSSNSSLSSKYSACFPIKFSNANLLDLPEILQTIPKIKFKEFFLILDFSTIQGSIKWQFQQTIFALNSLYLQFTKFQLAHFIIPQKWLKEANNWMASISHQISPNFRVIIFSFSEKETFHVNPILDGCLKYAGIFLPTTHTDYERLNFHSTNCHLNSSRLRASVNHLIPYCHFKNDSNGDLQLENRHNFLDSAILQVLQGKYNFRVALESAHDHWGSQDANRTWNGITGRLLDGTADIGLCGFTRSLERSLVIDFTTHTYYDSLTFMALRPPLVTRNWIAAKPFSSTIWACILASYEVIGLLASVMFCLLQKEKFRSIWYQSSDTVFQIMVRIILRQSTKFSRWRGYDSIRLLFAVWILVNLILTTSYGSIFYSILTIPKREKAIDSIPQLLAAFEKHQYYMLTSQLYTKTFLSAQSDNELYYRLGSYLNQSRPDTLRSLALYFDLLERESGKLIAIQSRLQLRSIVRYYYNQWLFQISSQSLNLHVIALGLPKRSPLLSPFNRAIQRMHETGFQEHFLSQTFDRPPTLKAFKRHLEMPRKYPKVAQYSSGPHYSFFAILRTQWIHPLTLPNVISIFWQWLLGMVLAAGLLVLELAVFLGKQLR